MQTRRILGLAFLTSTAEEAVQLSLGGGLVVAPSGPGIGGELVWDPVYREALQQADFVLPDSGAMVLAWNVRWGFARSRRLARLSGLKYLDLLLRTLAERPAKRTFWVMPSVEDQTANLDWLRGHGFPELSAKDCYLAPNYPAADGTGLRRVEDPALLARLEAARPDLVFVNIGGGTQEQLGWYLRRSLSYRPTIICTGAAIAFLTGRQANIPAWADRFYLGWLMRIWQAPGKYLPRYLRAARLFWLIARYGENSPPPGGRGGGDQR